MKVLAPGDKNAIASLGSKLQEFYSNPGNYPAFEETSAHPTLWEIALKLIQSIGGKDYRVRILEVGAGRSGLGKFLRCRVDHNVFHLTSHDVTTINRSYLEGESDEVCFGPVERINGEYDIILHAYVYEHVCDPSTFNECLWGHLKTDGHLLIQCPRYDFPYYLPNSLDHMKPLSKACIGTRLLAKDFLSIVLRQPAFSIVSDPAVFHLPFKRDRDAVHRVCLRDIRFQFRNRAKFKFFDLKAGSVKDYLVKKFLTLRLIIKKLSD